MAASPKSALEDFEDRRNESSTPDHEHYRFVVVELMRYYPEPVFRERYGIDRCRFWDVFDITLSDKYCRRKFVLTADAKWKSRVCIGCTVRLKKFECHLDESSLDGEAVIVIHDLEVTEERPVDTSGLHNLTWVPAHYSKQQENVPLASHRCYYMDNCTFTVDTGKLEGGNVQRCDLDAIDFSEVYTMKDVMAKKVSQYKSPCLLVKVMRKSRLVHYVTPARQDKWPFQLPLVLADESGWCCAVLWNNLGLHHFCQIQEGCLLLLKNFRVKTSVQVKPKSFFPPPQGSKLFKSELSLEMHHPVTEVKLVNVGKDDDVERLHFPLLEMCLMTRKELISVPDLSVVDVAGTVTFVGRVERERRKASISRQEDSGAFFYRKFVHLRDSSVGDPFVLLVYAGDQKEVFDSLRPGQQLLCRHMLTNQQLKDLHSSRQKRYSWLTTTTNSWIYLIDRSNIKKIPEPLSEVMASTVSKRKNDYIHLYREGGFFRYPPSPASIEALKESNPTALEEMIVPSGQWKTVLGKMTWQECHQLILHATLSSFTSVTVDKRQANSDRNTPTKKRKSMDGSEKLTSTADAHSLNDNHLGVVETQALTGLWPKKVNGSREETRSAFVMKWQGLSDSVMVNTVKPYAFGSDVRVENFKQLVSGAYDSELGLIGCGRSDLTRKELTALQTSAEAVMNSRFILLVDVYTNCENQQLIVLNRAYQK